MPPPYTTRDRTLFTQRNCIQQKTASGKMSKSSGCILVAILITLGGSYYLIARDTPSVSQADVHRMERLAAEIRKYGPETKREGGWKITCWRDRITERPGCSLSADLVGSSGQTEGLLSITRRGSGHMQITVVSDKSLGTQWLKYRVDEHAADSLQCLNSKCFWELAPDSEIYAQIQTGERFHTVLGGSLVSADITGLAGAWPLFDDMRQKWGAE